MIYVLGSLNMDMVANIAKMPKQGETLTAQSYFLNCGGKGANQAVATAKLGGKVSMIGKVGNDAYGAPMIENLSNEGVLVSHVSVSETSSGIAIILVEKGDNRIILHKGANHTLEICDVDEGLKEAKEGDILLAQLEIPMHVIEYAFSIAKQKKMTTILNPAPAISLSSALYQNIDIIAPNESETEILTGTNPMDEAHIALAVKHFYALGVKNVIITLGKKGSAVSFGQEITLIDAIKVKVVDTTGAGDTFVGAVAVMLEKGLNIVQACQFATCASAITIQRKGASSSIPKLEEVQILYERQFKND